MAVYFRSISVISLVANVLILPAQPALMLLASLALILGLIALPLCQLAAYLALPPSTYTLNLVQAFAHAPAAIFYLDEGAPWLVALFYLALFALTALLGPRAEQRPALVAAALRPMAAAPWRLAHRPEWRAEAAHRLRKAEGGDGTITILTYFDFATLYAFTNNLLRTAVSTSLSDLIYRHPPPVLCFPSFGNSSASRSSPHIM
jgi:hypothetical protein